MNKIARLTKFLIPIVLFFALPAIFGLIVNALTVNDGIYKNIYGWYKNASEDCTPSSSNNFCDDWHLQGDSCTPSKGTCTGKNGTNTVYKFICNGEDEECGGNGLTPISKKGPHGGTLDVFTGITCGQTVQLDVFEGSCPSNLASCKLIDYIVWYSGDCQQQPPPACNTNCASNPSICNQTTDGCTYCDTGGSGTCQTPPQNPQPACNTNCSSDPSICLQAKDGCTTCNANSGKCEAPPSNPPPGNPPGGNPPGSSPPVTCNTNCSNNPSICLQASDGCTACNTSTGRCEVPNQPPGGNPPGGNPPTATPPPTPTPTPDFDPAMCKCDGMDATTLFAGQISTFTAFGKVEGADTSKAAIESIEFFFGSGDKGSATGTVIGKSDPIAPMIESQTTTKVRYKGTWDFKIPDNIDTSKTYRAWAKLNCAKKQNVSASVLAESDENISFFGKIVNFFRKLISLPSTQDTPQQENTEEDATIQQLKLRTIEPAKRTLNACNIMLFEFPSISEN